MAVFDVLRIWHGETNRAEPDIMQGPDGQEPLLLLWGLLVATIHHFVNNIALLSKWKLVFTTVMERTFYSRLDLCLGIQSRNYRNMANIGLFLFLLAGH